MLTFNTSGKEAFFHNVFYPIKDKLLHMSHIYGMYAMASNMDKSTFLSCGIDLKWDSEMMFSVIMKLLLSFLQ